MTLHKESLNDNSLDQEPLPKLIKFLFTDYKKKKLDRERDSTGSLVDIPHAARPRFRYYFPSKAYTGHVSETFLLQHKLLSLLY